MVSLVCPHCGDRCNFVLQWFRGGYANPDPSPSVFTCDGCGKPIAAMIDYEKEIEEYWPTKVKKDFPDVPSQIASTASEAHICLGAGSPRGAVALARAVVESVAKDKGIHKGGPQSKIDSLHQQNYISDDMRDAAHEIRFAGNEAAHGDVVAEPLNIEDAEEIIKLMDAILQHIYQRPAEVARIRARREEREAKTKTGKELTGMDLIERELGGQVIDEPPSGFSDEPPF